MASKARKGLIAGYSQRARPAPDKDSHELDALRRSLAAAIAQTHLKGNGGGGFELVPCRPPDVVVVGNARSTWRPEFESVRGSTAWHNLRRPRHSKPARSCRHTNWWTDQPCTGGPTRSARMNRYCPFKYEIEEGEINQVNNEPCSSIGRAGRPAVYEKPGSGVSFD
jgi:hypothetical protein